MIRKVRFPLKIKLTALILVLLLSSTCVYLFFAIQLFKADKSAYIFEDVLKANESLKNTLGLEIKRAYDLLTVLDQTKANDSVLAQQGQIIEYSRYELEKNNLVKEGQFLNQSLAEEYGQLPESLADLDKKFPYSPKEFFYQPDNILSVFNRDEIPHIILSHKTEKGLSVMRFLANNFVQALNRDQKYFSYLIKADGSPFANIDNNALVDRQEAIDRLLKTQGSGVSEVNLLGAKGINQNILMAHSLLKGFNLILVSEIPVQMAFRAGQYLINKSLYFGILLMAISVIVGILFARRLTNNLSRLAKAADFVAAREFDKTVSVKTSDEIGALSDSFNSMFKQIRRYMEEMKEKARLENELEVAKLVQEAFIPDSHILCDNIEVAAYYHSASACGGDWWSYLDFKDRLIFFIADATGHGVPAAFLTATANATMSSIRYHASATPELIQHPGKILQLMNHNIRSMGNNIHMTAFVAIFEKDNGKLTYSNASHPHPYFVANQVTQKKEVTKQDIQVLLGQGGPRLGHEEHPSYPEHSVQLEEGDSLLFYTDGVLENSSDDKKPYGQRKFIKSILENLHLPLSDFRHQVVGQLLNYLNGNPLEDDITMAFVRFNRPGMNKINEKIEQDLSASSPYVKPDQLPELLQNVKTNWDDIFVLSDKDDEYNILQLLGNYPIRHLIGGNSKDIEAEIALGQGHTSYIDGLVGKAPQRRSVLLSSSDQIKSSIDEIFNNWNSNGMENTENYLKVMANELLTNAFYNTSKDGPISRQTTVTLPHGQVKLELVWGEKSTLLGVQDPYGAFSYDNLRSGLIRGLREKKPVQGMGGAGLGLYFCFNFSNQLIVNVIEEQQTEVICLIENTRRYKDYKSRITSLHYNSSKGTPWEPN